MTRAEDETEMRWDWLAPLLFFIGFPAVSFGLCFLYMFFFGTPPEVLDEASLPSDAVHYRSDVDRLMDDLKAVLSDGCENEDVKQIYGDHGRATVRKLITACEELKEYHAWRVPREDKEMAGGSETLGDLEMGQGMLPTYSEAVGNCREKDLRSELEYNGQIYCI